MIYSYDIFNTIIGRDVLMPEGVFYIMQERMLNSDYYRENIGISSLKQFAEIRKKAEQINACSKICPVTQIDEIYRILSWLIGGVSTDVVNRIKHLEIDTEHKVAFGIEDNIEKVKELLDKKERVVFISDMYFSSEIIKDILFSVDERLKEVPIYVSSEYGCTKGDAGLFLKVRQKENVDFCKWIHVGDNEIGDVLVPELLGIETRQYKFGTQLQIENTFKKHCCAHSLVVNIAMGIARRLRSQNKWNKYEYIGGYIGGGVVFSYVSWVIENSVKQGIKKLYFVARDGYVLKRIADVIIETKKYEIKTEYIYGSRKAWRAKEKEKAIDYINEKIKKTDYKMAFVDYQSAGESLDTLLEDVEDIESILYFVYGFDYNRNLKKVTPIIFDEISRGVSMEVFCRAPHGETLGYKLEDAEIKPVIAESDCKWSQNHQTDFLKGLVEFSEEAIDRLNYWGISVNWREYNKYISNYINSMEDSELNNFIGDIIHDSGEKDVESQYAPPLNADELEKISCLGEEFFKKEYYKGANLELSIRRSSALIERVKYSEDKPKKNDTQNDKKKGKNILLYTAGRQGKKYYSFLSKSKDIRIVGWTDLNSKKYIKEGLPLISIKDALSLERDCVLIPMSRSKNSFKNIANFLKNIGFEDEILSEEDVFEYIRNTQKKDENCL